MNFLTFSILQIIGTPFLQSKIKNMQYIENYKELYYYAFRNRIPLLFLDALKRDHSIGNLNYKYELLNKISLNSINAISKISRILKKSQINFTFFKSVRPYHEKTVDIDVLIFNSDYKKAFQILKREGYRLLEVGPLSVTFLDVKNDINIDIYNEVGVSYIIYLDKNKLKKSIINKKLQNGETIQTLNPGADIITIIAHSIIKEQLYVLSEYYTTLYYLANMNDRELNSFLSLVQECGMSFSVKTHLGITALIHLQAYGFLPMHILKLVKKMGFNRLDLLRAYENNLILPHKFHPLTIAKAFIGLLQNNKSRKSFVAQIINMLNPKLTSYVIKEVLNHITRITY
ncbi:MAG: hypothetical protein ACFFDN_28000 [Candidatus Hodarchaeota archaeon]